MNRLTVLPLGVGDAFSTLYYSSCLAVGFGEHWLLVDCPHPIRKMLREASLSAGLDLDVGSFSAVALTHLHADHSSGLEGLFYFAHFALGTRPLVVAHPDVLARMWPHHLAAGMDCLTDKDNRPRTVEPDEYFVTAPVEEGETYTVDGFAIECRRTVHHIPTTAFRIRAGHKCVAYSSDTAYDTGLIDWLAEADLVIHETNFGIHTPYERLAELPAELRAKMRLIHYPDTFPLDASVIEPLRQGVALQV